jgi:hypothetical protein
VRRFNDPDNMPASDRRERRIKSAHEFSYEATIHLSDRIDGASDAKATEIYI